MESYGVGTSTHISLSRQSSCNLLTQVGQPVVNLHLSHPNGTTKPHHPSGLARWNANSDPEEEHDQLVDFLWSDGQRQSLPFAVTIHQSAYIPRHKGHFTQILCSQKSYSLVRLDVYPPMRITKKINFPRGPFHLQNLEFLSIRFGADWSAIWKDDYGQLIQNICQSCEKLSEMHLYDVGISTWPIPTSIQNMRIPESLEKLNILQVGDPRILQIISKSYFPLLTELEISVVGEYIQNGVIKAILNKTQQSLKVLRLIGSCKGKWFHNLISEWMIHFPEMRKMTNLHIFGNGWHLEDFVQDQNLSNAVPQLTHLELPKAPTLVLQFMATRQPFMKVTELVAEVTDENVVTKEETLWYPEITDMQNEPNWKLKNISCCFPNLTSMELEIRGNETTRIKFIFLNFQNLLRLTLRWGCKSDTFENARDNVEALLIGCTVATVKSLREEKFSSVPPSDWSTPSIRNLNQLISLRLSVQWIQEPSQASQARRASLSVFAKRLKGKFRPKETRYPRDTLLITDLSFIHGFRWIQSLTDLHINASIQFFQYHRQYTSHPSSKVLELWSKQRGQPVQFTLF